MRVCELCRHEMAFERCGYASIGLSGEEQDIQLCHTDDHDCYHRWTVYGERPAEPTESAADILRRLRAAEGRRLHIDRHLTLVPPADSVQDHAD